MTAPKPALAMAAPAYPPNSAWDELVGSPQYHVMRSHTIAPISPAKITPYVTTARSTMPAPTVFATAVPNPNAAMKLKNAAHMTAFPGREHARRHDRGDRIRRVVKPVDVVENERRQDDGADDVNLRHHGMVSRYAFLTTTPSRRLATSSQRSVASSRKSRISFHLMIITAIVFVVEETPERTLVDAIGFVLEAIDLDGALGHARALLERLDRQLHLIDAQRHDARELARAESNRLDLVHAGRPLPTRRWRPSHRRATSPAHGCPRDRSA